MQDQPQLQPDTIKVNLKDAAKLNPVQLDAVSKVFADLQKSVTTEDGEEYFTATTGLRLRLQKVNTFILQESMRSTVQEEPVVPKVPIKSRPGYFEDNPDDPDYVLARERFNFDRGIIAMGVYLGWGTELVEESLPPKIVHWADPSWSAGFTQVGIDVPTEGPLRYFNWLRYYALSEIDLARAAAAAMKYNGVLLEVDVADAEESFRDTTVGSTSTGGVPEEPSLDRDNGSGQEQPS